MLSICIPIFNKDIKALIKTIRDQAECLGCSYEIICIDDSSDKNYKEINRDICNRSGKYVELNENIGRARIRNLFAINASFEYLLFLDCDLEIIKPDFLKTYLSFAEKSVSVCCGGLIYDASKPLRSKRLRWKYGHVKEIISLETRKNNCYKSFMTSNFLIHRDIFSRIKFDERLSCYGHEDTLFGYQLSLNNIPVIHIDNPVLHPADETNSTFVKNTEQAILNLVKIMELINYEQAFIENVTILAFYKKCQMFHLPGLLNIFHHLLNPLIRFFMIRGYASIFWFDLYKLNYLAASLRKQNQLCARG